MSKVYKKKKAVIVAYDDLSGLFRQLQEPMISSRDDSSITGGSSFTGSESYEEAYDSMLKGDEKSYKKLSKIKTETDKYYVRESKNKLKTYNHVVGYTPNVPNAIMGLPNSMINSHREPKKNKVIDVFINRSRMAGTSTSQIEYEGALILSFIDSLERDGYRVALSVGKVSWNRDSESTNGFMVPIKRATEPLNIKKVAFYLIHPSFLRRIGFRIDENEPRLPDITNSGYGAVMNRESMNNFIHENISERLVIIDDSIDLNRNDETSENIEKLSEIFKTE